jgi:cytoskeletal protein CcmA (bactofilin family)
MSDLRIKHIDESEIDSVLAEDIEFEGDMVFEKPVLIKGKFHGKIRATGDLFISRQASVDAEVQAMVVSVQGHVSGDVHARTRLELFASSSLAGSIRTPDLIMQSGCVFNGTCRMDLPGEDSRHE